MDVNLHKNCHHWRGMTASLLYWITTRYLKPFMNYSGLKIRKSNTYTHTHTYTKRQLKIIFLDVSDHLSTLTLTTRFFLRKHSFLSEKAKEWNFEIEAKDRVRLKQNGIWNLARATGGNFFLFPPGGSVKMKFFTNIEQQKEVIGIEIFWIIYLKLMPIKVDFSYSLEVSKV